MSDQDTKQKIIEASTYLFGVKGYDGTSTREIAHRAGVNIASLNYHFRSKQGILEEVTGCIIVEFRDKIKKLAENQDQSAADFALNILATMTEDGVKMLNHFKLFLGSGNVCADEMESGPIGWEQLSFFLRKELNKNVPPGELLWASSVIFTYIMHTAVMSASVVGKKHIDKYLPLKEKSFPIFLKQLVETLIRDLNNRYSS